MGSNLIKVHLFRPYYSFLPSLELGWSPYVPLMSPLLIHLNFFFNLYHHVLDVMKFSFLRFAKLIEYCNLFSGKYFPNHVFLQISESLFRCLGIERQGAAIHTKGICHLNMCTFVTLLVNCSLHLLRINQYI